MAFCFCYVIDCCYFLCFFFFFFFFFFQAEDGIRDLTVTGVQTCALPISAGRFLPAPHDPRRTAGRPPRGRRRPSVPRRRRRWRAPRVRPHVRRALRSEEHTSELQSQSNLVCRLLLEKKKP